MPPFRRLSTGPGYHERASQPCLADDARAIRLVAVLLSMLISPSVQGRARAQSVDGSRRGEQQKWKRDAARPSQDLPDVLEKSHDTLMQARAPAEIDKPHNTLLPAQTPAVLEKPPNTLLQARAPAALEKPQDTLLQAQAPAVSQPLS